MQNQDETDIDTGGVCQDHSNLYSDTSEQIRSSFNYLIQTLGTNLTGTLTKIDIQTSNQSFIYYGSSPWLSFYECDDSTYGSVTLNGANCNLLYSGLSNDNSKLEASTQSFYTDPIVLNPSKYYLFTSQGNNIFNVLPIYYGSTENTVDGACYQFGLTFPVPTVFPCVTISDLYFRLYGISKYTAPPPPLPVGCITDCFSNILFLPGLMGSRLYEEKESADEELWVSSADLNHADLALDTAGKSVKSVYTKNDTQNNGELDETGIVDDVYSFNIYQSFIQDLRDWKSEGVISNYVFMPYDWRLSLEDIVVNGSVSGENLSYSAAQDFSESFILKKLENLQSTSKSGKVTIIAHSNGGLVAKALVQKLKDINNPLYNQIDKIILVAVPQVGTPDALAALLHGSELGPAGLIMENERSRQLSENMSSIYNFLPSAGYFTTVDPAFAMDKLVSFENKSFFAPQTSQYGVYVSNETELKNYVLGTDNRSKPSFADTVHPNIGNSVLYTQAQSVHQMLDAWQPSPDTKVIQVAGWGEETLAGLDYKTYLNLAGVETLSYKPRFVVDGDGTVVVPSALWMSVGPNVERWWVDLSEDGGLLINRVHKDILEISNLRNFLKSKIIDSTFTDPESILVSDTSTLISNKSRLHYTLHSPLTLGITDAQGRYTGQDPVTKQIKEEIPGITYKKIGDVQFISAPDDIAYTLKMQGYEQGSFSLDVDKQEVNTVTASTSFQGIPSSASTLATMDITQNMDITTSSLIIDQNGDGATDKTLQATLGGVTIYDVEPPELQVTFDINTKDVIFSAIDTIDQHPTVTISKEFITLADKAGNTTVIPFLKFRELPTRLRLTYNKIIRNGVTTTVPNTNIIYDWQEKKGALTDLDTRVVIKGEEKYTFNYKKAKDVTVIKEKISKNMQTKTVNGFVVVTVKTKVDGLVVDY